MSEHTKEPWHTGKNHNAERFIYGEDGWAIAECVQTKDKMFANARRIVACVNACKGISTEKLEGPGMLVNIPDDHNIIKQRDELLINLKKLVDMNCPITGNPSYQELLEFWHHEKDEGRGVAVDMINAINAIINCEATS